MPDVFLESGRIDYLDTGGELPPLVLIGGLAIGSSLWDAVVDDLHDDFRCIVPTLPWGTHRHPMHRDTDLSLPGQTRILGEFLDHLDLNDVTLVENDTAMAQVLVTGRPDRIGRVVFCSCETWDNAPPGVPGRSIALAAKMPGGLNVALQQMRLHAFRRGPMGFG
jgi:pimeloyl-ACP methyl ester carboxylesterase